MKKGTSKIITSAAMALSSLGGGAAHSEAVGNFVFIYDLGEGATGERAKVIQEAKDRIANMKNRPPCPVLTKKELEPLLLYSKDQDKLRNRYSAMAHDHSTLGSRTNLPVMRACEEQAQRILFFWQDTSNYPKTQKKYGYDGPR